MNKIGAFFLCFVLGGLAFSAISLIAFAAWGVSNVASTVDSLDSPEADFSVTSCREVITAANLAQLGMDIDKASVNESAGSCEWSDDDTGARVMISNSSGYGSKEEQSADQLQEAVNDCSSVRAGPHVEYQPEWLGQTEDETFTCVQSTLNADAGSGVIAYVYDKDRRVTTTIEVFVGYEQQIGTDWQAGLADLATKARQQS